MEDLGESDRRGQRGIELISIRVGRIEHADEKRFSLALQYVMGGEMTVELIADRLGYRELQFPSRLSPLDRLLAT